MSGLRGYNGDILYEVWRAGGNPDAVDADRVADAYADGLDEGAAAGYELAIQREDRERADAAGAEGQADYGRRLSERDSRAASTLTAGDQVRASSRTATGGS